MLSDVARTAAAPASLKANPFPGLRPFESHESAYFFGRDEQCDELLGRLARNRLVAVVGASGSGKSSLVRAGLLPALQRGYLPSAGSSWRIATFRPGGDPIANLTESLLVDSSQPTPPQSDGATIAGLLRESSLGLVNAATRLLGSSQRSLLVLADQFEEIFRYRSLGSAASSAEDAVECINLLLAAAAQDQVPVYVVLTMRSDYLGDCARFAGLPEALNDSQFLVPRMTRQQLREAIEGPVAVGNGRIAPGLVQRLLYDVDAIAGRIRHRGSTDEYDHDQLPVVQHALMRMWEVSREARAQGRPIDLTHYENPPVETIHHALDRHAEEIYSRLPSDYYRDVARLVFQLLTERDAENREVRRPAPRAELVAVAAGAGGGNDRTRAEDAVRTVLQEFGAEGRAFVVVNAQQDVDIAHESFIRKWRRLGEWVKAEAQSRRIYLRLAETAAQWEQHQASLYRGPELIEADRWWKRQLPSPAWAQRYDARLDTVRTFLRRSRRRRWLVRSALALTATAAVVVAVLMTVLWQRARAAEQVAQSAQNEAELARNEAELKSTELNESQQLLEQALAAVKAGDATLAEKLRLEAELKATQANQRDIYTPTETKEIDALRKIAKDRTDEASALRTRLDTAANQLKRITDERDNLQARLNTAEKPSTNVDDRIAALQRDRDNDRKEYEAATNKLKTEIADLNKQLAAAKAGNSGPNTNTTPVDSGSIEALFESGVRAYDLGNYVASIRYLQEAVERLPRSKSVPKDVRMSGNRFVPFAPNSYLAVTLFDMKTDCSAMRSSLRQSQNEPAAPEIRGKLQSARTQCGGQK